MHGIALTQRVGVLLISGCLPHHGQTKIQTDQSNASYTETSSSTSQLIGQIVFLFSVMGQATVDTPQTQASFSSPCCHADSRDQKGEKTLLSISAFDGLFSCVSSPAVRFGMEDKDRQMLLAPGRTERHKQQNSCLP